MEICSWCKKETDKAEEYSKFGINYKLCPKCVESVNKSECIKCHSKISNDTTINGLCNSCFIESQVDKLKEEEEIVLGLGTSELTHTPVEMTEEDVENWLTLRNKHSYGPSDLLKYRELKRLWILVKLNAVGIYDDNIINSNMEDIEELVDYNIRNLLYKKCRIIICNTKEDRQLVKSSKIICNKNRIYIIENLK